MAKYCEHAIIHWENFGKKNEQVRSSNQIPSKNRSDDRNAKDSWKHGFGEFKKMRFPASGYDIYIPYILSSCSFRTSVCKLKSGLALAAIAPEPLTSPPMKAPDANDP